MKIKQLCPLALSVLVTGLALNVSAQTWTGGGTDTLWSDAANWDTGVPGTNSANAIFGTAIPNNVLVTITNGEVENVGTTSGNNIFGPQWGSTLNIYGTLNWGFIFVPVQFDPAARRSVINMYAGSSMASVWAGNTLLLGDAWFTGQPYVTMNLYGNASASYQYLGWGGHLNIYDNATNIISVAVLEGGASGFWGQAGPSDATRQMDIAGGTLVLPTGYGGNVANWIARGIFLAYGKPNDTNDLVITDDGSNTYVTTVPLGGSLQTVFIQPLNPAKLVAGTFQQAKLLGNYPNVTNVLLSSAEPGVDPASLPGSGVVNFSSSNPKIFTVSAAGLISALSAGSATLTATLGTYTNTVTVTVTPATATLIHRYSFNETSGTTTADSVGGAPWAGTLTGTAAFSGTGQLVLDGSLGAAVQLPAGIVSNLDAVTIEAWATFPSAISGYANLFAFGNTDLTAFSPTYGDGENYIALSPHTGTTNVQANFGIGLPGFANEHDAVLAGQVLDSQTNVQIVAVFNPLAGVISIYTNGVPVASYNNLAYFLFLENIMPSPLADTLGADPLNYIGESLYTSDPGLLANIDEFRIYNGAVSAAQVAAENLLGPNQTFGTNTNVTLAASLAGSNLVLKWPTSSALVKVLTSPTLGAGAVWTPVSAALATDGSGNYEITMPNSGTTQFFRLEQ